MVNGNSYVRRYTYYGCNINNNKIKMVKLIYCHNCQENINYVDSKFCKNCGESTDPPLEFNCVNGHNMSKHDNFCMICGQPKDKTEDIKQ